MKIVLVTPYSWTTPGGVNSHVSGLAEALIARGHEARVLAPADGKVPPGVVSLGRTVPIPYNGSVARLAFGPRVVGRIRVALHRTRPDVVHVHEPFAPSASLLAVLFRARRPVVATFHADAPGSRVYRAARPLLRPLYRRLAARIAVSAAARDTVSKVFGPGDVLVIPNGISTRRFASVPPPDPASRTVVFLGRLEQRKGAHVLLAAVPRLRERVPSVRVVIAGDGPARRALEESVPADARDAVEFRGRVEPERLADLFAEASVVCVPSLGGESFGIVLLEAMAAGRPVVASAIPGYAAVVRDGTDGTLVPPGDPEALASSLELLLRDPAAAKVRGEAARVRAAEYDWSRLVERVEDVYRRALRPL